LSFIASSVLASDRLRDALIARRREGAVAAFLRT
jgi:hypothetical protein